MKRIHIFISGKVQGVFFRAYTQKKAQELGLCGWVQNLPDGQVEVVAEGSKEMLEIFWQWCYQGSPSSKVTKVEAKWSEAMQEWKNFFIR